MDGLYPVFESRAFEKAIQPGLALQVDKMTWDVQGGCRSARLIARVNGRLPFGSAKGVDLDQFAALLRCPVVIYGADGRRAWWGLVWGARIQDGQAGAWLSLGDLVNRARTVYGLLEPEATGAGRRQSTAWADDLTSQGIYGVKEGQYSLNLASTTQAESFRSSNLAQHAQISPRPVVSLGQGESLVTLDLRGWWDTLGWRFYENSTGLIENTNRLPQAMKNVCTLAGERMGQSITVSDDHLRIESIWFCLRKVSSSSTITVEFCADSGGSPGTVLASATMNGALLSKSPRWTRFSAFLSGVRLCRDVLDHNSGCGSCKLPDPGRFNDGLYRRRFESLCFGGLGRGFEHGGPAVPGCRYDGNHGANQADGRIQLRGSISGRGDREPGQRPVH